MSCWAIKQLMNFCILTRENNLMNVRRLLRKTAKQFKLVVPCIVSVELQVSVKVPQLMACQHCYVMRVTPNVSFMYDFTCTDN